MQVIWRAGILGVVVLLAVVLGVGTVYVSAQDNPRVGTWKFNAEKSKYNAGQPPKSLTMKIEASGDGEKVTTEGVNATGAATKTDYTAQYDGKDYAITGTQNADKLAIKRVDPRTVERTFKKDGKAMITSTQTVSADGKSMTNTVKGTDAQGQAVDNVQVWDKQ